MGRSRMKRTIAAILGLALALSAGAQSRNFQLGKFVEIQNAILKELNRSYVDSLPVERMQKAAIDAMLQTLDPYTVYYPADKDKDLKMMITGKYAGIGSVVRYNRQLKRVIIEEPYENMPAAEVGLKKGDIILSIDDSVMTSKNVTDVSERLRGAAGSTFVLKVKRPSTGKTMSFKITRRNIKVPAIP